MKRKSIQNTKHILRKIYKLKKDIYEGSQPLVYFIHDDKYVNKLWYYLAKDFRGKDLRTYKKSRDIFNDLCWFFFLSKSFIRKYANSLNWNLVCTYQKLDEKFIEEMKDKVNWEVLLESQKLSEDFIRKNAYWFEHSHWYHLSMNENIHLSEGFIREFKNELEWCYISGRYDFTKNFLREMSDKVFYKHFYYNNRTHLKKEDIKEFTLGMDYDKIKNFETLKEVLYK